MHIDAQRLREKGWSEQEIAEAKTVVAKVKRRKHPHHDLLPEMLYWGLILLSAGTMVVATYWIIPLIIVAPAPAIYPFLVIIGFSFGALIDHAMKELDHLKLHHHLILTATVPITGIVSFMVVLGRLGTPAGEAWSGSLALIVSFLIPYLYRTIRKS